MVNSTAQNEEQQTGNARAGHRNSGEIKDRPDGYSALRVDRRHLGAAVEHVRRSVYFEYIVVVALETDSRGGRSVIIYTDLPPAAVDRLYQGSWADADPALIAARGAAAIVSPEEVAAVGERVPAARELLAAADSMRIAPAAAAPVYHLQRQVGVVTFSRHKAYSAEELFYLGMVAPGLHREFSQDIRLMIGPDQQLSRREVECLRYASTGMTSEEIAAVLPLAAATVTAHLRNAAGKLGASNRVQAIAESLRRGIID